MLKNAISFNSFFFHLQGIRSLYINCCFVMGVILDSSWSNQWSCWPWHHNRAYTIHNQVSSRNNPVKMIETKIDNFLDIHNKWTKKLWFFQFGFAHWFAESALRYCIRLVFIDEFLLLHCDAIGICWSALFHKIGQWWDTYAGRGRMGRHCRNHWACRNSAHHIITKPRTINQFNSNNTEFIHTQTEFIDLPNL